MPTRLLTAIITGSLLSTGAGAQERVSIAGLGSLSFPNSGAADAQDAFHRGVLLLHSFEYGYAAAAFREAQEIDPDFALAYWGEAMTHTHPVWNEKDTGAAREILGRYAPTPEARAARAPTPRERGYLHAIDVLYGDGPKARLDSLYSQAMANLAASYPDDMEAQTFYALSLLGLSQGDRDVPTYMEAGAIGLKAFELNPGHPGAAHYTIHAFDDPTHAVLAMPAARTYGELAPNAGHALHMTSHIFLARGMWDDVVDANIRADGVTDRNLAARNAPPTDCGHYNEWLLYGYQQQGRMTDAENLLMGCYDQAQQHDNPGARRSPGRSYVSMRNLFLADSRDWTSAPAVSTIDVAGAPMAIQLMQAWGDGIVAAHTNRLDVANTHLAFLKANSRQAGASWESPYAPVWVGTLTAAVRAHEGKLEEAITAAREAADHEAALPVDFGPPIAFKPAREAEGNVLAMANRHEEAITAFRLQLARTPNRIRSLVGLARSARAAGRADIAAEATGRLENLLKQADPTAEILDPDTR